MVSNIKYNELECKYNVLQKEYSNCIDLNLQQVKRLNNYIEALKEALREVCFDCWDKNSKFEDAEQMMNYYIIKNKVPQKLKEVKEQEEIQEYIKEVNEIWNNKFLKF